MTDMTPQPSDEQAVQTPPTEAPPTRVPGTVFVSYARGDREKVGQVVEGLRLLGKNVWLDEALVGGQSWWDTILAQIRACDVMVQTISPATARSEACNSERKYAAALGKPIQPVFLERMPTAALPEDLAVLQYVDYTDPTPERRAFKLAAALGSLPPAPPLPAELPEPPEIPMSYLVAVGEKLRSPTLTLDEQSALVGRLRGAAGNPEATPEEREGAVALLREMRSRDDLYHSVAVEISRALEEVPGAGAAASAQPLEPAPAAGASPPPAYPPPPQPSQPSQQAQPVPAAAAPPAPVAAGDPIETELRKWNWGAFLLAWIWGIGHNVYRSFLTLIPIYGFYELYLLGRHGNRWAWEKKSWPDIASFRQTQRKWALWGAIVDAIIIVIFAAGGGSG